MEVVRGVTFDLDDTLWCGARVIRKANAHFHAFLQTRVPAVAAAFPPAAFDAELSRFMRELPDRAHDFTFLRKYTLRYCIETLGTHTLALTEPRELEALLEDAFQAFLIPRSQPEFFAGVDELLLELERDLARIHAGPRLGVITNGNCVLAQLPQSFQARMQFMVSAEQVGVAKPARAIFDAALAHLATPSAHVVHVGDHYTCDIVGAKAAGLRTIWVNAAWDKPNALHRRDLAPEDAAQYSAADAIVTDVTAVLDVVRLWNREAGVRSEH